METHSNRHPREDDCELMTCRLDGVETEVALVRKLPKGEWDFETVERLG